MKSQLTGRDLFLFVGIELVLFKSSSSQFQCRHNTDCFGHADSLEFHQIMHTQFSQFGQVVVHRVQDALRECYGRFFGIAHTDQNGDQFGAGQSAFAFLHQFFPGFVVVSPVLNG